MGTAQIEASHERRLLDRVGGFLFVAIIAGLAHWLYSPLGFNPTDDGFILAYSRRLLNGQIPHRDFISIRPVLSAAIHIPEVALGGDYTFLLSRLVVWLQFACIAWLWVHVIQRLLNVRLKLQDHVLLALITFTASVHTFPITAWHTIDGLFLISIGLTFCISERPILRMAGFFLLGTAYLCKQSFVLAPPLILLVLGYWRSWKNWLAVVMPGIVYLSVVMLAGAMPDALQQLGTQTGLLKAGLLNYLTVKSAAGVVAGIAGGYALCKDKLTGLWLYLAMTVGVAFSYGIALWRGELIFAASFFIFGMLSGLLFFLLLNRRHESAAALRTVLLSLIVAWSASLSLGYDFPALCSGHMLAVMLLLGYQVFSSTTENDQRLFTRVPRVIFAIACLHLLVVFHFARTQHIYREGPAKQLTHSLGGVLRGAKGIHTNANAYAFLADLNGAIEQASRWNAHYAIVPDCAAVWVKSVQPNPLPIDWPQQTELSSASLLKRVTDVLRHEQSLVVLVQKYEANALAQGKIPLSDRYAVVRYVRENMTPAVSTQFFDLYRQDLEGGE